MSKIVRSAPVAVVLALAVIISPTVLPKSSALAAGESVTWGGSTTITEQDPAAAINSAAITIDGGSLDSGSLEFEVSSATSADVLSLETVGTPIATNGAVSVVGSSVYLGNGSSAENVGSIDATNDGTSGNPLTVNFVNSFPNADFEVDADGATTITGWTAVNEQIKLDAGETIAGYPVVFNRVKTGMACGAYNRDDAYDVGSFTTKLFQVSVTDDFRSSGLNSLKLRMSATGGNRTGWVIHGPAVYSSEFQASQNDVISFDWMAVGGGDDYSVYGYIVRTDGGAGVAGTQYSVLDKYQQRDGTVNTFARATHTIQASGSFRFVFVAGAHNRDGSTGTTCGGNQGDSTLYIDNVVVVGNKVTAAVAQGVAQLVRYRNTSDAPAASRTVTATATYSNGSTTASGTTTVVITAVNDAPVIDGDGGTTTVGVTVTETDISSVENPLADVTGTLTATDPDGDSPTLTFGLSGSTSTGGVSTLAGDYGTLSLTESTGAYTYVPDMAAIKPLDTGDDPVDAFTVTVSDGSLSSTGTLNFTIDGITDTEPSAPNIAAVVGGDGFLSVIVDPLASAGGSAVTNFEYSTDGEAFRALAVPVISGPIQISTRSADGTTALENGTAYAVRVRAINGGGASPASNAVTGTPTGTRGINAPNIQSFEPSTALTAIAEDFTIFGFGPTDELLVTIGLTGSGTDTEFALANFEASGASLASGYSAYTDDTAVTDLGIIGTKTEVNAALSGIRLTTGTARQNFTLNVNASVRSGSIVQSGATRSFYEYVVASQITWDDALAAAALRTHAGVTGYLVTITSEAENTFVRDRISGATNVWIGASDATEEGVWRWVSGPEGQSGGTVFFTEDDGTITYASWSTGEPNNSGSNEDAAVTNWNSATGTWNDLQEDNSSSVNGYVVEYSEWGNQEFAADAVLTSSRPVSMGGAVLTATAGVNSASLSWTGPQRTGETVTSYSVTSVPAVADASPCTGTATACTIGALEAGTEYTFRVTATWSDSATSVSNAASARALAVPPPAAAAPPAIIAPPLPPGPVLTAGASPRPSPAPTARIGDAEVAIASTPAGTTRQAGTTTVSTATILEVGGVSLAVDVTGAGEVRTNAGAAPQISVARDSVARTSGGGLLPGTQVQAWLPLAGGTTVRPVTSLPVAADGTFTGELPFDGRSDRESDGRPLPIGTHVLQLVGVDAQGEVTVIEQTVRIEQPAPAPEPDRGAGAPPTLTPGASIATNAGVPEAVTVVPVPDVRQARVEGSGWNMAVDIPSTDGRVSAAEGGGALIELVEDDVAEVSGDGFLGGTRADVWLFSTPTLLGSVTINADGTFSGEVPVDGIATGEHTLQLQGVGRDGYVRAANLGVVVVPRGVDEPAAAPEAAPEPEVAPEPEPEPDGRVEVVTAAGDGSGSGNPLVWIALIVAAAGSGWWFLLGRRRRDDEDEEVPAEGNQTG